ncbi:MAG: hypothetical protein IJ489_03820 [Clostridia bacterium]|nr:hypothetical protein [Clostridia bacterium]
MKKIFFSDEENLSEKAFLQGIATCVFSIIFCLIALCSATWAWFRTDISSASNTIQTGTYTLKIDIENVKPESSTDTTYIYELPTGTYRVGLSVEPSSVGNGYCKIKVDDKYYYTANISASEESFSFTLDIRRNETDASIPVTFELCWGIYSGAADVTADGTLTINHNTTES